MDSHKFCRRRWKLDDYFLLFKKNELTTKYEFKMNANFKSNTIRDDRLSEQKSLDYTCGKHSSSDSSSFLFLNSSWFYVLMTFILSPHEFNR